MDKEYENKYHQIEQNYWWFVARWDIIKRLIKEYQKEAKILEMGCSAGLLIKELHDSGFTDIHGIDISKDAIKIAKEKGIKNIEVSDAAKTKFKNKTFDVIIASDILEHIQDDHKTIFEWKRLLKENGTLIIFVPAFMSLWSKHDEVNKHFKRYKNKELIELAERDFNIIKKGYWNFSLFFPMFVLRKLKKKENDDLYNTGNLVNKLLLKLLTLENYFIEKGLSFPVGVSTFVVAKLK